MLDVPHILLVAPHLLPHARVAMAPPVQRVTICGVAAPPLVQRESTSYVNTWPAARRAELVQFGDTNLCMRTQLWQSLEALRDSELRAERDDPWPRLWAEHEELLAREMEGTLELLTLEAQLELSEELDLDSITNLCLDGW